MPETSQTETRQIRGTRRERHVCPWWLGYFLASPLRRLLENPEQIVGPYVREGMTVLDVGPGMGYFSLPMARMVGEDGRVICVDIQGKMLESLRKRARRAGLLGRIETRLASESSLDLDDVSGTIDFTLAFAVVHETPDQTLLFGEIQSAMKSSALMLLCEPTGHVTRQDFDETLAFAHGAGFETVQVLKMKRNRSVLLRKKTPSPMRQNP
ncbi:MAG: class I SAM-dependent methyltransferase [Ignavibacteria bacterium]|nr:class I SAM-dependent methyltransferase [Ignavibacteria bacterium]